MLSHVATSVLLAALSAPPTYMVSAHGGDAALSTYAATIAPIPGTDSGVSGKVVVFVAEDMRTVAYGGFVGGLQSNLQAAACTAKNGCGVHIHSGTSCEDAEGQGGHFFAEPVASDPWVEARYSSGADGTTTFVDILDIGTDDISGRAFLVHAEDGSRVGCGLLEKVDDEKLLIAKTEPLRESSAEGEVTAFPLPDDPTRMCLFGSAENLEPNLLRVDDSSVAVANEGDCTAKNGCGAHIHAGTSCTNSTTQMGHYYNKDVLSTDPWAVTGYSSTDANGNGLYAECLTTGFAEYSGRVFIVHANDGSRVSCGALHSADEDEESASDASAANRILAAIVPAMMTFMGILIVA